MPDVDPIKVKVVVEYDPEGLDQAKKDLESLNELGSSGGGVEATTADLADLSKQAEETAGKTATLNETLAELPKIAEDGGAGIEGATEAFQEHTDAVEETALAHEDAQSAIESTAEAYQKATPAVQQFTERTQDLNDSFSQLQQNMSVLPEDIFSVSPETYGNLQAFQQLLDYTGTDDPFNIIYDHLAKTGQSYDNFASSLGGSNEELLNRISDDWHTFGYQLDGSGNVFNSMGKSASEGFSNVAVSAQDADKAVAEFLGTSVKGASGVPEEAFSLGGIGEAFGGVTTGLMDAMNQIAMPLMAIQMIGMAVSAVGQGIYNMAAIAEGPAAHSVGTFTGTIDALTQSATNAGAAFSEGLGQGMMPTLNAINNQTSQSNGGLGGLGEFLGGIGSKLVNLWNVATPAGDPLAGLKGFANQGAALLGIQQPFQGPGPEQQQQIQYQQAIANMPQTVAGQVNQANIQTAQNLADAITPANLQAQDNLSASQQIYQRVQASYNASHPVNQYALLQQAQYDAYAAQQQQNYQYQMQNNPAPSYLGSMLGDVFSGNWGGAGADFNQAMTQQYGTNFDQAWAKQGGAFNSIGDFFAAWGNNIVNGPNSTYGVAPNNPPPNILGGISGIFGGLGQDASNFWNWLTNPSPNPAPPPSSSLGGGCFPAGTPILMENGSERAIETLRIGDHVRTHDGIQHITATITYPAKQTYTLTFSDGNVLTLTDSHPVATLQGWKSISPASTARENPGLPVLPLHVGDDIYTANGATCRLISIDRREITHVYNITVAASHTYYAGGILVHNAKGLTESGTGTEQVSLSHTFTAQVTWQAQNLEKQFTAAAQWAEQGLTHAATMIGQWAEQGLEHLSTMIGQWAEQGLEHLATMAGSWAEQGLEHLSTMAGSWAEQGLEHLSTMVGSWAEEGLSHLFTGQASWIGQDLDHTFTAIANWEAQNLNPTFDVAASFIGLPLLAEGASNFAGGPAIVGEGSSPEVVEHNGQYSLFNSAALVNLPPGANVYPMSNLPLSGGSPVTQFADGTGSGPIIPINLPFGIQNGGGGSMPQSINLTLQIGDAIFSQMGIPMAANMRLVAGYRGY